MAAEGSPEDGSHRKRCHVSICEERVSYMHRRKEAHAEELHVSTPAQRPPVDGDSCCSSLLVKWIGGGGQTMDAGIAGTVHSKNKRDVRRGTCNKGYRSDDRMEIADGRTTSKEVHGRSPMEHRLLLFLSQEELEL